MMELIGGRFVGHFNLLIQKLHHHGFIDVGRIVVAGGALIFFPGGALIFFPMVDKDVRIDRFQNKAPGLEMQRITLRTVYAESLGNR